MLVCYYSPTPHAPPHPPIHSHHHRCSIQLYTAFFAVLCIVMIILLFFQFGQSTSAGGQTDMHIMIGVGVYTQVVFSVVLALSIVAGARLNDAATLHRFRLSRIETLICDYLVSAETPGLSSCTASRAMWKAAHDSPVQRHLRLTRQVASSLSQALIIETTLQPARVLFMPANFALLSTFWSLSLSGGLSAVKAFHSS